MGTAKIKRGRLKTHTFGMERRFVTKNMLEELKSVGIPWRW